MMIQNSNLLKGVAASIAFICVFSFGIAATHADRNSNTDAESGTSGSGDGSRKVPWVRAHDLAAERNAQIENDIQRKGALVEGALEDRQAKKEENMMDRQQNLCTNMIERNAKMSERLNDAQKNILDRKANRRNIFDENRDERDVTLEKNRSERNAKREEMYAKLLERAGDDADKKAAVVAFKAAAEKAVSDRQQAVDTAIAAFRTGVDAAIGAKKMTIDSSLSTFKPAVDAAFLTAKSECDSGVDPVTVRKTLQASLKNARAIMGDQRKDSDTVGEQVRALAEAKKVSFAAALSDFKLALEQARANLKAAFGSVVGSGDGSNS